jgi:hypothetical protein
MLHEPATTWQAVAWHETWEIHGHVHLGTVLPGAKIMASLQDEFWTVLLKQFDSFGLNCYKLSPSPDKCCCSK